MNTGARYRGISQRGYATFIEALLGISIRGMYVSTSEATEWPWSQKEQTRMLTRIPTSCLGVVWMGQEYSSRNETPPPRPLEANSGAAWVG